MKLLCIFALAFLLSFCNSTIQVQDTNLCVLGSGIRRLSKPFRAPRARSPKFHLEIHEPETVTLSNFSLYPDETVLIIVDAQRDFCDDYPKATLPVPGARDVVARINDVRRKGSWKKVWGDGASDAYEYLMIIRTEDTHPADHISFSESTIWENKFATINEMRNRRDEDTENSTGRHERIRARTEYLFDVVQSVDGANGRILDELTARKELRQQQATQSRELPKPEGTTTNNDVSQQPAPTIDIPSQSTSDLNLSPLCRDNQNKFPAPSADCNPPLPLKLMDGFDVTASNVLPDLRKASDEFLNQCLQTVVEGQVKVTSKMQMYLWPVHCVVGMEGQKSHPELDTDPTDTVVAKGVFMYRESLSGVVDYDVTEESNSKVVNAKVAQKRDDGDAVSNSELLEMNRINILHLLKDTEEMPVTEHENKIPNVKRRDIETIVIVGFAFEYCVYETAMSLAKQNRWEIIIVVDAVGYLLPKILRQTKFANLITAGVKFVRSNDIVLPVGPKHTLAPVSDL